MRIIATLTEAASIRRYLDGVDLPVEPPLIASSPATPAATKPRLRRLKNSTAHPPGIVVDPQGEIALEHVKFGGNVFEGSVEGDGVLRTMDTPHGRLSGVICWDMDFPSIMRQSGRNGTDILFAPSGDWREVSPFHVQMSVFRAIENGFL